MAISQPARHRGGGLALSFRVAAPRGGLPAAAVATVTSRPVCFPVPGDELRAHPAEEIVHEALRHRDVGVLRVAPRLKPGVRELLHIHFKRYAVLQAHRHGSAEGIHQAADRAAFLGHRDEQLAWAAVVVEAHGDVALVATDVELMGHAPSRVRQPLAPRRCGHLGRRLVGFAARVERLALLRAIAVDGQGLEAQPPALHVGAGDVGRRRLPRHVHRLGDGTGDEGLRRGHHVHVRLPGDASLAEARLEGTVEHGKVLALETRRPFDRVVLVNVGEDSFDRRFVVAERPQCQRHRLVDDLQHATAGKLLVLHQRDVGLNARRIAIHQERDGAGGGEHRRLGIAEAVLPASTEHLVPHLPSGIVQVLRARRVDLLNGVAVHLHDGHHRFAVCREAVEGTNGCRQVRTGAVGGPMEDRGNRTAEAATSIAVVGKTVGHQQAAEVRIAEAQRPVQVTVAGDPGRRITRVVDQKLLRDEEDPAGRGEPLHVEVAVRLAELHQVDAGEVAGRVIEEHVLRARIRRVDPARVGARVPAVDRGVVLHARVAALPSALSHPAHHLTGLVARPGLGWVGDPAGGPGVVAVGSRHEIVGQTDREIGVLEED